MIGTAAGAPGNDLTRRFTAAEALRGKTRVEIVALAGPLGSVSALPGGKILCHRMATGNLIALRFDGDCREGETHEAQVSCCSASVRSRVFFASPAASRARTALPARHASQPFSAAASCQ